MIDALKSNATLHVYEYGGYQVIASSATEAEAIFDEEWSVEAPVDEIRLVPDDERITISTDAERNICPYEDRDGEITMSASRWAEREGAGALCMEAE